MEKITYLVTNYNNEKYVGECLLSICAQINNNWKCLVIDDASTDNSVDVIKQYTSDKLRLVENNVNIDQFKSIIKLMELATTDIVCVVDSDDAMSPETTGYILDAFAKSPRIGFVYTNGIEYDENLKRPLAIGLSQRISGGAMSSIVFGHVGHFRCFRKSVYHQTSGYNLDLLYAEDLDLGYKLEEVCETYFVNKYVCLHRRLPETRGRKIENKLLGYKNRRIAKHNAIERREIKGMLAIMCKLYVFLEYKKCTSSKTNNKIRKWLYKKGQLRVKKILNAAK